MPSEARQVTCRQQATWELGIGVDGRVEAVEEAAFLLLHWLLSKGNVSELGIATFSSFQKRILKSQFYCEMSVFYILATS